jgi:sugar lactone lactonase YvrE
MLGAFQAATAQTVYENYTFITLAGPPEAGAGWYDGAAAAARFHGPSGVATDLDGNVYVADSENHTIRKITSAGEVTTLAGLSGTSGSADGTGSAARFFSPSGVAVDAFGNVFVTDTQNQIIRKITPAGVVTTLAGFAGAAGSTNGMGNAARFNFPFGIALDINSNLYIADSSNFTIRKLTPAGLVSTLAGLAGTSGTNDGTGAAARFNYPEGVAVDASGNVYVADTANHTIRKITVGGVVTKLAGATGVSGSGNGMGGAAGFYDPCGVAVDTNGNVFVADTYNNTVREITPTGMVTTPAGTAGAASGADGTGAAAGFHSPYGVSVDASGNLYIADTGNNTIRKITTGAVVSTLGGMTIKSGSTDGTGGAADFNAPRGVAQDTDGNTYVADTGNHLVRKITPDGSVTTLAGLAGTSGSADGSNNAARFYYPENLAVDTGGNVYVADTGNHTIRKITPDGVVTTFAGRAGAPGSADGSGHAATFNYPYGVAADTNGNIYVADTYNSTIRKITSGGMVTTLAGLAGAAGSTNGTGGAARFDKPCGVAVSAEGNLFVADTSNHAIRKITPAGVVTTLAGLAGTFGSADGSGDAATFNYPFSVAVDAGGNLFVADTENHTIRAITPAGVVTTLAGLAGNAGGTDETGSAAGFAEPYGVAVDGGGVVYVADTDNNVIRKGWPALPDRPVVDLPAAVGGVVRHLDVTNLSTASWSWRLVRQPSSSSATLSAAMTQTPTITPDVPDLFVLRFEGTNAEGRVAIGTVSVVVDETPPTLNILSPTPGQLWSNATFNVTGTAADNVAVSHVWCQVNGNDWSSAMGSTNWEASVTLAPGTNTIRAYAADTSGNLSPTNSALLVFLPAVPVIQSASQTTSGFSLIWSAIPGRSYQVQYNTRLNQTNWSNVGGAITATAYSATAVDLTASTSSLRFYRVALLP